MKRAAKLFAIRFPQTAPGCPSRHRNEGRGQCCLGESMLELSDVEPMNPRSSEIYLNAPVDSATHHI